MTRIYIALGVLASLCSGLQAQTRNLSAKIPFDFQIGSVHMPAGDYRLEYAPSANVLWLHESKTRTSAAVMTVPVSQKSVSEDAVITFNRYGDEYFFAGVWGPQATRGSIVPKSPREKELASGLLRPEPTVVALRK